ncbi:MAG: DUF805 domain-containing protein [Gammaproteobacteria bacterium]|nr:DUF805 domain-containing protein [Gammaproteobacteria bacterium]
MQWYLKALKSYATFSGRSQRSEYWFFMLFNLLIIIALAVVDNVIGTFSAETGMGLLSTIYNLAVLIPSIAVGVRRLHDTGRSGWWILIGIIPIVNFIGFFVLLVFFVMDSQPGTNEYGPNPKGVEA